MAVTPTVINSPLSTDDRSIVLFTWVLTTANPTGLPVQLPEWRDHTVHAWANSINSDAWGGATLTWQGSNQDIDAGYDALNGAASGTAAAWTADAVQMIIENPLFHRPKLTTVGSGAQVTVTLLVRRANPNRQ